MPYDAISTTEIFRSNLEVPAGKLVRSRGSGELQLFFGVCYNPQVVTQLDGKTAFGPVTILPEKDTYIVTDTGERVEYRSVVTRMYTRSHSVEKALKRVPPSSGANIITTKGMPLIELPWGSESRRSENKLFTIRTESLIPLSDEVASRKRSDAADRHALAFADRYRCLQDTLAQKRDKVNDFFSQVTKNPASSLALVNALNSANGYSAIENIISHHFVGELEPALWTVISSFGEP